MHDLKRIDDQITTVVSPKITSTFSQEKFNLYMSFICFQLKFRQTFMIYINVFYKKRISKFVFYCAILFIHIV